MVSTRRKTSSTTYAIGDKVEVRFAVRLHTLVFGVVRDTPDKCAIFYLVTMYRSPARTRMLLVCVAYFGYSL